MSQSVNKLLAVIPRKDFQRLQPNLRTLHLSSGVNLPHCGQTRVYFPGTGLCSIINTMVNGGGIEVACIGNEGVVGMNSLACGLPEERNGFVQVGDGIVEYMPALFFERELARNGAFREAVDRFCHAFLQSAIQAVACNRLHTIDQRCCRWLSSVHDRIGRGRFELNPRFLARAMGVRTSDVTTILTSLEDEGVVTHDGQSITIRDAIGLRRLACGCYPEMRRAYTKEVVEQQPLPAAAPRTSAKVLPMPSAAGACTQCGSSIGVPHVNGHACILALDSEIAALVQKTHTLRKYRAQLLADRAHLYRHILKRSSVRI